MGSFNFNKDLEAGEKAQDIVLERVRKKYPNAKQIEGNFKYWDIEVPGGITIEVKNDLRATETGNYYIETRTKEPWTPSGINHTKSDWWVIYDGEYLVWIKTPWLRTFLIGLHERKSQPPANAKDALVMWGYLVKREQLFAFIKMNCCGKVERLSS